MNRRTLRIEQKLDAFGCIDEAIGAARRCIDVESSCGPRLVDAFRALNTLGELREVVDALPTVEREPRA